MRIVSLLPSATEIVYALGLGDNLVGVSHECDYPAAAQNKPRIIEPVFDTQTLNSQRIDELVNWYSRRGEKLYKIRIDELERVDPDLIITQELCDVCAIGADDVLTAVNQLSKNVKVLSLNPHTLKGVEDDIRDVARATGILDRAEQLIINLEKKMEVTREVTGRARRSRVFCVEWLKPVMNAGHWVPEMVELAGGVDELAIKGHPSFYVDWNKVVDWDPEIIVLMPCGFTTKRTISEAKHMFELEGVSRITAVRNNRVFATDGHNYFSRSGPRLFDGIRILAQMFHPELFSEQLDPELGRRVEIIQAKA